MQVRVASSPLGKYAVDEVRPLCVTDVPFSARTVDFSNREVAFARMYASSSGARILLILLTAGRPSCKTWSSVAGYCSLSGSLTHVALILLSMIAEYFESMRNL